MKQVSRKISAIDSQSNAHHQNQIYCATTSNGLANGLDGGPLEDDIYITRSPVTGGFTSYCGGGSGPSLNGTTCNYYSDDIWSTDADGELLWVTRRAVGGGKLSAVAKNVFLDVLLPSGFLMPVQCPAYRTLAQLKQDVFIQAKRLPPLARLTDTSDYIFATIGLDGASSELYDEQKPVSSLQTTCLPVLELLQPDRNAEEKSLAQKISTVIGFPLADIERQLCEELALFRLDLFGECQKAADERGKSGTEHYAFYHESLVIPLARKPTNSTYDLREVNENDIDYVEYPDEPDEIRRRSLDRLRGRMEFMNIYLEIWWRECPPADVWVENKTPFTHSVRLKDIFGKTTAEIIRLTLERLRETSNVGSDERPSDFILQVAGQRVFIDDEEMDITEFQFVRSSLENYKIPHLLLRRRAAVFRQFTSPPIVFEPAYSRKEQEARLKSTSESKIRSQHFTDFTAAKSNGVGDSTVTRSSWDLDENLRVRVHSLSKIGVGGEDKVFVRVAVAVGRHILDVQQTALVEPSNARFMEGGLLEFGVYLEGVPESAHFSFSLICVRGAGRATSAQALSRLGGGEPLGWTNFRLFDWRHNLLKGKQSLALWPFPKELQETARAKELNLYLSGPLHPVNIGDAVAKIEMEFAQYKDDEIVTYKFPGADTIAKFNAVMAERRLAVSGATRAQGQPQSSALTGTGIGMAGSSTLQARRQKQQALKMRQLLAQQKKKQKSTAVSDSDSEGTESDGCDDDENSVHARCGDLPFTGLLIPGSREFRRLFRLHRCLDAARLSASDQAFLWRMRHKLCELFPQLIIILADCKYIWRERERTCEFYELLGQWPPLRVETAIELLDGRYTDGRLRAFAVENLDETLATDDQFRLYLLALVQAVRYEAYASSPLVAMLIRRSVLSFRIAHTVFWLLRAELAHLLNETPNNGKLSFLYLRYALMLEAICRGNAAHLDSIIKQVEMVSQLTFLSALIRNLGGHKDAATKRLQQELEVRKDSLQYMDSPLNPIDRLGELFISDCRVLGSAKMPLRLVWRNPEPMAHLTTATHQLIFKNGDDMRQDMLTIQVMRIMDSKWKSYNCDYCMTLYDVLPMGKNIGLIQVVQNCRTLFEIQCEAGPVTSSLNMDTNMLHKFLYRNYDKSNTYMERVERFSASLAGYCIATYVIGIRDRHQDNIMIADDGRIFHIDFGHFLGHTKRKLGINRERTDFILTEHFLSAISHCKDYRKSHEFSTFRDECVKGFMIVYDHARFYIALFRMMLCMGLPELSAQENVDFLKDALMYEETDRTKVCQAFQATFDQAIRGDWSVSVNWFFHSVKHM